MAAVAEFRRPESVLVVVHTPTLDCLLLERVEPRGFWQSVTGTLRWAETPAECAARELAEETGLAPHGLRDAHVQRAFPILPAWRSRYAPGVDSNVEHRWYLEVPGSPCGAHRADGARGVSLVARRRCHRARRVVDQSRGAAAIEGFAARVISVVTVHGLWMRGASMAVLRRRLDAARVRGRATSPIRPCEARWPRTRPRSRASSTPCPATPCTSSAIAWAAS